MAQKDCCAACARMEKLGACGSACGNEHGDACENEHGDGRGGFRRADLFLFGAGAALLALSAFDILGDWAWVPAALAALLCGWETMKGGLLSLMRLRADEELLMTVAVLAAFAIGEYTEGAMVAVLFSLGERLEDAAVDRSEREIRSLANIRPDTANLVTPEGVAAVKAEGVAVGSEILVKAGERVPIDAALLSEGASADLSALTGESLPADYAEGAVIPAGAVILGRPVRCKTVGAYGDSAAARILELVENGVSGKGRAEKFITRFAAVYTPCAIGAAALIAALPPVFGWLPFAESVRRALTFLVASCPCALVISIPLSYFAGIGAASKAGALFKGSQYLELLAKAKVAAFDKTGTVTSGEFSVTKIYAADGFTEEQVLAVCAAAETYSDHPFAKAVREKAARMGLAVPEAEQVCEIAGCGLTVTVGGRRIACGNIKFAPEGQRERLPEANIYLFDGETYLGALVLADTPRENSAAAVAMLKRLGVSRAVMLTGDNERAAAETAALCGMDEYRSGLMPEDKVDIIREIKKSGVTVFAGDGINDAPVLAAADIGAAMGMGTDAAIESADLVLMRGGIGALAKAVWISKKTMACVRQNTVFILGCKAAVLTLGALGLSPVWLAVFADVGVTMITVLWSARLLRIKAPEAGG